MLSRRARRGCLGLQLGADADVVLFDPNHKHTLGVANHHMRCDYSAFEGREVQGKVRHVFRRGEWVLNNGQLTVERGSGLFLPRYGKQALLAQD